MSVRSGTSHTKDNIAVAYIRVSTKKQKDKGFSPQVQREFAQKYAEEKNLLLEEAMIFEESKLASSVNDDSNDEDYDLFKSSKERPELQKILELAQEKKFKHLIVYTRDRLVRSSEMFFALKMFFHSKGIEIHYSRPGEFSKTNDHKFDRFFEFILASFAEFEVNTLAVRVKAGSRESLRKGYWTGGRVPFGYVADTTPNKKSVLKASGMEMNIVREIFDFYNKYGFSYKKIADIIEQRYGSHIDAGESRIWTKSKIEGIINNETYTGHIVWDRRGGRRNPGRHDKYEKSPFIREACIIDKNQWLDTVELRKKKSSIADRKYYDTPFILKGKLVCSECGEYFKCKNYGGKKKSVYRCPTMVDGKSECIIKKDEIELRFMEEVEKIIHFENMDMLWELYQKEANEKRDKTLRAVREIEQREKLLEKQYLDIDYEIQTNSDNEMLVHLEALKEVCRMRRDVNVVLLQQMKDDLKKYFKNKQEFYFALTETVKKLSSYKEKEGWKYENHIRRIYVDMIVDKVVVKKENDGISLDIIISPPKCIK